MHEKRLLHGFTEDEAAFIIVCAMKAAATDTSPAKQENSLWFERYGIRAVVAQNSPDDARLLTGFIWNTKGGKKAVDSDAANNAQRFYALDELRRVQIMGAALQKAVTLFEQIVNNNPENWEQIITAIVKELQIKQNTKAEGGVYEGSPLDAFSATAAESADLFTDGALEAENAIVTKPEANFSIKPAAADTLDRLTATVKIKRSPSKRLQGKMTAPAYRELERAINLMALSDRAYQDEIETVIAAHETLARAINQGNTNLTSGNALLIKLAGQLTTSGQQVTPQTLSAALANHEASLKIYGNVSSKTYEQTRLMAM